MDATIDAVRVAGTPNGPTPIVVLAVDDEEDILPIFIGFEEATSIARGVDATDLGRPLTHDLLLDVIEELGGRVDRVHVASIDDGTYIGEIHLNTPRQDTVVDARPSDALALAARTDCPITVAEAVFEAGREAPERFAELDDIRDVVQTVAMGESEGFYE
ncbi:bifunctional nuclease family protein [Halomarina litorea]|uniref:bifunctional nuclease family protein n=1 Tax=Halomarina litorea TaxID=2961595 RepID=UPI0020C1B9DC|nr:bifunctional nuclease family protein [Halomarina sp. BCD28]